MNIILVGVRGAGKSSVGHILAFRMGYEFIDLDRLIEKREGRSVAEIIASNGIEYFREKESLVLREINPVNPAVIATGGGVVINEDNRRHIKSLGVVVYLKVSPEESVRRLNHSYVRPPLTGLEPLEEARYICNMREMMYQEVADIIIDTDDKSVEEVADAVQYIWKNLSYNNIR